VPEFPKFAYCISTQAIHRDTNAIHLATSCRNNPQALIDFASPRRTYRMHRRSSLSDASNNTTISGSVNNKIY